MAEAIQTFNWESYNGTNVTRGTLAQDLRKANLYNVYVNMPLDNYRRSETVNTIGAIVFLVIGFACLIAAPATRSIIPLSTIGGLAVIIGIFYSVFAKDNRDKYIALSSEKLNDNAIAELKDDTVSMKDLSNRNK